eukprot:CAMPEP_0170252372 /NCGR_PEP_ID=MMETSP0116_2-20130129/26020_1 /TAXON_ID=400756 /ORGANISM="Durinskia baltica, Strain CSIRO CS-38" /LENGTH=270 /DNA_ID=CAMNT_0010503343 /DNA_START=64 /DNA_END=876 /DNA_ORIENTATION=+
MRESLEEHGTEAVDLAMDWLHQLRDGARPAGQGPVHLLWGDRPEGQSDDTSLSKTDSAGGGPPPQRPRRIRGGGNESKASSGLASGDSSETPHMWVESVLSSHSVAASADYNAGTSAEGSGALHVVFPDDSISEPSEPSAASAGVPSPLASIGSAMHGVGRCRPCMFIHTIVGCANGAACEYCHISHRRRRAARPCKAKRDRFKAIADRQAREAGLLDETSGAEVGAADVGEQRGRGDASDHAHEDWADEFDQQGVAARRNAQGRRILQL